MVWRRWITVLGIVLVGLTSMSTVLAHANLIQASPAPNAVLATAPAEIRMAFTEPLEPDFSSIRLRDKDGNLIDTPASVIDANDAKQMYLTPGDLPDGLYTVAWRVVSAADGHPTIGSYAFIIGDAAGGFGSAAQAADNIPVDASLIRWIHLISLSL